jgi:hypothetical protein
LFLSVVVGSFATGALAQASSKPQAQLPLVYLDTTWNPPTGGTTWAVHTSPQLSQALANSVPGDIIVLDAGVTYNGYFQLPAKSNPNNKWIYIMSSGLSNLPAGTRVSPASVPNMATIVTPGVAADFQVNGGANHWRLAGLELKSASTQGCQLTHTPPINCFSYFLVGSQANPTPLPDSITIDRCYIHGSPTIDIQTAVQATASNYAVVDSYISDIHMSGFDTQTIASNSSPGPFKIVNNYLSAAGENIMFGGAGGWNNPYIPSDIQIQYNYLFKPLSWAVSGTGGTLAPGNQWVEKNALELKNARRVLFDNNVIQNVWAAGQNGFAIVLTVRTTQSGDNAVVNDITITNNILNNVAAGVNALAEDDLCGASGGYPNCHNPGSQDRWNISNNLILFYDPKLPGGGRNVALAMSGGINRLNNNTPGTIRDIVFQHNTSVSASSTPCWESIYFSSNGQSQPFAVPISDNLWFLDNALCRQPTGDWGYQGMTALTKYMGNPTTSPNDITQRFYGNVMWVPPGDGVQTFPAGNLSQKAAFTYINPSAMDYQLLTPVWTNTSDGQQSGINNNNLPASADVPPDGTDPN